MPPRTERSRRRTARNRIVAWLLLLVTVVLAANLLIATRVLNARTESRLDDELGHEYQKLAAFVDRSGADYTRVDRLLNAYLASTMPEDDETYFSVIDGRPDRRSSIEPLTRLDLDRELVGAVGATATPELGRIDSDAGEVRYGVFPVTVPGDSRQAVLVVAEFAAPERAQTVSVLRTLLLVSVGALAAAGVGAWLVAGRLLRPIRAVSETAESISESDLTRRIEVSGDDDVAELARTFNRMRPHRVGLRGAARVPRRRRPRATDADHRRARPSRRHGRRPCRACSRDAAGHGRAGADGTNRRRPARARPSRSTRLPHDRTRRRRHLTVEVVAKAQPLGARRWTVSEVACVVAVADGQRLTQALIQLVTNAVAHTAPGDLIDVGSAWRGGDVLLWVRDGGPGIAEDTQATIFDRFATFSTDGNKESTGLGLAIVRSIAEAHGGEVRLRSRPGEGTTFTLRLPLAIVDATNVDATASTDGDSEPETAPAGPAIDPAHRSAV